MNQLVQLLFWIAVIGSVTSTIYCLMVIVAAIRFGIRRRREDRAASVSNFLPPVSVLKPLHGTEDGLERNLETFLSRTTRNSSSCSVRVMKAMPDCS